MKGRAMEILRSYDTFEYSKSVLEESVTKTGKMILKGIFQKADTLNQNARIYPYDVLAREVRNYQKFIVENRSTGELDHPSCVPHSDEILTQDGWKTIGDISNDEIVATLNVDTNQIEYHKIEEKIDQHYSGPMYEFSNMKSFDMLLTPTHRILLWDRENRPKFVEAEKVYSLWSDFNSSLSHSSLRRSGVWVGNDPEYFEIDGHKIDSELWAAFLGIYVAEGHCNGILSEKKIQKSQRSVAITQIKQDTRILIEELLEKLPWEFKQDPKRYTIVNSCLYDHLYELGSSHDKHLPQYAKDWSPRLLEILMKWMLIGDGRNRKSLKRGIIPEYSTTSTKLASDVYEVMLKLGHGATVNSYCSEDRPAPDFDVTGRVILAEDSMPMNIVYQHSSKCMSLDRRFMDAKIVPYDGRVCCVRVKNGTWLLRHNGKVCWTGNSSVVSLERASHIVRELYMDGDTVYGSLEVLDKLPMGKILRGLIESEVKVGVSSRGVGSTEPDGEYQIVQPDFQLICIDAVSEPSTTNAFIHENKHVYVSNDDLKKIFRKSDRIDRIVNEILTRK